MVRVYYVDASGHACVAPCAWYQVDRAVAAIAAQGGRVTRIM